MNNSSRATIHLGALASALLYLTPAYTTELPILSQNPSNEIRITANEKTMLIVSKNNNNVLKWNSFNVSEDAVLSFDNHNYLNLVTGGSPSVINGRMQGYGNVYIINPAGISAGLNSSIQVSKLGLITSKIDDRIIENFRTNGNISLPDEKRGMGRVNLLGQINADNLVVDGGQIVIRDIANIRDIAGDPLHNRNSERLNLRSSIQRIDIGCNEKSDVKTERNLSGDDLFLHRGETPVSTKEEMLAIKKDGKYFLTNDLNLGELSSPLLQGEPFSGSFDGAYSRISYSQSGANAFSGIFASLNEAEINRLFINAAMSVPTVNHANLGGLAANIKNSTLKDLEIHTTLLGEMENGRTFNFGTLAGSLEGNNYLNNVIAVTTDDTVLKLSSNDKNSEIKAGLIAGCNNGLISAEGFSYGMTESGTASLPQLGKLLGFSTLASSLNEALENAGEGKKQFLKISEDPSDPEIYTNKNFYDPFFTENFALDSDVRSPDYIDLSSNQSFYLPYFATTVAKPQTEAGLFEFTLKSKRLSEDKLDRGFYFINTDLDNNQTSLLTGKALVTTVVPKPDPDPITPEPTDPNPSTPEPSNPDPEPTDPDPDTPDPEPSNPDPEPTDPDPSLPDLPKQETPQPSSEDHSAADDGRDHEKVATTRLNDAHQVLKFDENQLIGELMLRAPKLKQDILQKAESFIQQVYAALTPASNDPSSKEKEQRKA